MRTTLTILILFWTVPAYAVNTLQSLLPDPVTETWQNPFVAGPLILLIVAFGLYQSFRVWQHSKRLSASRADLAEANRELTVETALERVRARAVGMQKSTDIGDVARVLFGEMVNLGFEATRSAITTTDSATGTATNWWGGRSDEGQAILLDGSGSSDLNPSDVSSMPDVGRGPDGTDQLSRMEGFSWVVAWRLGETPYHLVKRSREEVVGRDGNLAFMSRMSEEERESYFNLFTHGQWHYFFFFKQGWVSPVLTRELSEDDIDIGVRFAQVFALAYARFEELRKNEAQNRQLSTEAAMERVRSSVASMTATADLGGVVEQMLMELQTSGVAFDLCVINIIDEAAGVRRQYGATPQGWSGQMEMSLSEVSEQFLTLWRAGKPVVREVDDALAQTCFETRSQMGVTGEMVRPMAVVDAPFAYGTLSLQTHKTKGSSEKDLDVVAEFARVVSLGYTRYLDIVSLEEQNQKIHEANRMLEDQNRQIQEANRLKSRFLVNMSHELRTPLNAVIGYSEMLAEDAREGGFEKAVPDLGRINQAGRHLLTLVNDLLDISKIEAGKMELHIEVFDLSRALTDTFNTVEPLARRNRNEMVLHCSDDIKEMRSDATKIRQILLNLLSNANKFTEDGQVSLNVGYEPDRHGTIVFEITDTGIGMSEPYLEKLFDPFSQADASVTREHGGTGLGLAITRHFCQMLYGDISVQSEPGKGSTFTVRLPDGLPNRLDDPT